MSSREQLVRRVLKIAGTTYAAEAAIRVNDKPMPLFQLLVLCMLASKPIDATRIDSLSNVKSGIAS